jgi:hypothetical protein
MRSVFILNANNTDKGNQQTNGMTTGKMAVRRGGNYPSIHWSLHYNDIGGQHEASPAFTLTLRQSLGKRTFLMLS